MLKILNFLNFIVQFLNDQTTLDDPHVLNLNNNLRVFGRDETFLPAIHKVRGCGAASLWWDR